MTRLVNDLEMAELRKGLRTVLSALEGVAETSLAVSCINYVLMQVNRWAAIRPYCTEMGAREIIENDTIGECGIHGLFWDDSWKTPVLKEEDCPVCLAEADERFQRERDLNERGDRKYHEDVDRDLVERSRA